MGNTYEGINYGMGKYIDYIKGYTGTELKKRKRTFYKEYNNRVKKSKKPIFSFTGTNDQNFAGY